MRCDSDSICVGIVVIMMLRDEGHRAVCTCGATAMCSILASMPSQRHDTRTGPARCGRFDATVMFNESICQEHYRLRLRVAEALPQSQPGQFVQLGCRTPNSVIDSEQLFGGELQWPRDGVCEDASGNIVRQVELVEPLALLRRPFSIAGRGDDARGTWLDVIHRVVGVGTRWLAELRGGDAVDLIGPLGNWFTLPEDKTTALLVGGGVGLPPMFYLAEAIATAHYQAIGFVGAMSHDLLAVTIADDQAPDPTGLPTMCVGEFAQLGFPAVVTTDDGTCGLHGRITDALADQLDRMTPPVRHQTVVYTCGPEPMMQTVVALCAEHDVSCQVCVEQAMACGMGTCQSCVVRIEDHEYPHAMTSNGVPWRYRLACTDGPVFDAPSIIWSS